MRAKIDNKIAGLLFELGQLKEDLRICVEVVSARLKYNLLKTQKGEENVS